MSSWGVQLVIGKLVTDDAFRQRFETGAHEWLATLGERGIELSDCEVTALLETNQHLWNAMAEQIDPRLRSPRLRRVRAPANTPCRSLTEREQRVVRGVFEGCTNKQIGTALGISESAVKATLQHVFRKTHVRTRAQLVRAIVEGR